MVKKTYVNIHIMLTRSVELRVTYKHNLILQSIKASLCFFFQWLDSPLRT
jgi:hypothetical protein